MFLSDPEPIMPTLPANDVSPNARRPASSESCPAPGPAFAAPPGLERWVATQARMVEYWLDHALSQGADARALAVLHQHALFLREAAGTQR